jgi:hypothetical protein
MDRDPAYDSSEFGIVVTQFEGGQVQVLHAGGYKDLSLTKRRFACRVYGAKGIF